MRGRGGQASSCLNWWVLRTSPLKLASHIRDPGRAQYSRGGWPTNNPLFWGKKQAPYSPSRSLFPTRQNFSLKADIDREIHHCWETPRDHFQVQTKWSTWRTFWQTYFMNLIYHSPSFINYPHYNRFSCIIIKTMVKLISYQRGKLVSIRKYKNYFITNQVPRSFFVWKILNK